MTPVWYHVRDLAAGRAFYKERLGFEETYVDDEGSWVKLERGGMEIGLAEGEPQEDSGVAHVDVRNIKAVADELRNNGVEVPPAVCRRALSGLSPARGRVRTRRGAPVTFVCRALCGAPRLYGWLDGGGPLN